MVRLLSPKWVMHYHDSVHQLGGHLLLPKAGWSPAFTRRGRPLFYKNHFGGCSVVVLGRGQREDAMLKKYVAAVRAISARADELGAEAEKEGYGTSRYFCLVYQSETLKYFALCPPLARFFDRFCWR